MVCVLTDRQCKVNINSTLVHPHKLVTGVPHGSVLSPLLFNIYIQTLFSIFDNYSHITYHSYADDIKILLKITDPSSDITTINNCLTDIHDWLSLNSLSLNCLKTEILHAITNKKFFYSTFPYIQQYIYQKILPQNQKSWYLN